MSMREPIKVISEDKLEEALTAYQQEHPEKLVHPMRVHPALVEAGFQITVECDGMHAVVTLDPSRDPELVYAAIDHLPPAVFAAIEDLVGKATSDG
jgi:hypothetical protein